MPFNMNLKAMTTGDGNCGLHCFVPAVEKILLNEGNTHAAEKAKLAKQFQEYYQIAAVGVDGKPINFDGDSLSKLLHDLDPKEKEALLEPVLREIMIKSMDNNRPINQRLVDISEYRQRRPVIVKSNSHLRSNELVYLAYELGINLESYEGVIFRDDSGNEIDPRSENSLSMPLHLVNTNPAAYELKIRHDENHWEFEMNCAKTEGENRVLKERHNTYYQANSRHFHAQNLARVLRLRVKQAVANRQSLKSIFNTPEVLANNANVDATNDFSNTAISGTGIFGQISTMIDRLVKSVLGPNTDTSAGAKTATNATVDMFGGIIKMLGNLLKAMFGFAELATQIGKTNTHQVSPEKLASLSSKDREETENFMHNTQLLASAGGSAQNLARTLNEKWSRNIGVPGFNSDVLWLELMEALKRHDKRDEAFELLKQRETVLIEKLKNEVSIPVPSSAGGSAGDTKGASETQTLATKFESVLNEFDSLPNVVELGKADRTTQKACWDARLNLYRKVIQTDRLHSTSLTTLFEGFKAQFSVTIKKCEESRVAKDRIALTGKS